MDEATKQQILDAIVPKSDQLNSDDLIPGPINVTIENVRKKDQQIMVEVSGDRKWKPWKPCKSMLRVMIEVFSDQPSKWKGHQLTLYRDPEVKFQGLAVGGIRISHMTGIDKPTEFNLTVTRGRKEKTTILPLYTGPTADDKRDIEQITEDIDAAETQEALKAVGFVIKNKPKAVQDGVRKAYAARQAELKKPADDALFDKGNPSE